MRELSIIAILCAGLLLAGPLVSAAPLGTGFTYQGQLKLDGSLCNGAYDFQFTLYDSAAGGTIIGTSQIISGVAVTDGQFTVGLDAAGQFGSAAFNGGERWLEIAVRPAGSGTFAALSPRQELTATPYALFSAAPWITGVGGISYTGGNVGIGTTTPACLLSVAGLIQSTSQGFRFPDGTVQATAALPGMSGSGTTGYVPKFMAGTMLSDSAIFDNNGNIGIGTTAPGAQLHVRRNGTTSLVSHALQLDTLRPLISVSETLTFDGTSINATGNLLGTPRDRDLYLNSGSQGNVILANAGGNVGIGTTSPGQRLAVSGNIDATGTITGTGVYGTTTEGYGVWGKSTNVYGVVGEGGNIGVWANNLTSGYKAYLGTQALAGDFYGNVRINGTLSKSAGSFQIDHPLDPGNKYLYHSFVESPDMKNFYDGVATTDESGHATVALPEWFCALNKDFRYQLTVLDDTDTDTFVQVKVVRQVRDNRFTIRTSRPRINVSWQITGVRQDAYANAHRIPVEEAKPESERGQYLHPDLYGQPKSKTVGRVPRPPSEAHATAEPG